MSVCSVTDVKGDRRTGS